VSRTEFTNLYTECAISDINTNKGSRIAKNSFGSGVHPYGRAGKQRGLSVCLSVCVPVTQEDNASCHRINLFPAVQCILSNELM